MNTFRVGITPDFYTDVKGRFEKVVEEKLGNVPGIEFEPMQPQPNNVATPEALNRYDAIFSLATKYTRASLQGVGRLALIARWGVGYDMIDMDAITDASVLLAITPNAVKRPVAESILTLIFALSKNILEQDRLTRAGKWRGNLSRLGITLEHRVLGSIGCGNIAREMFRLASSLGFGRFVAADPYVSPASVAPLGIDILPLEEVLQISDYVAVNSLLNDSTRNLIGAREFRLMRPTAYFINTARGAIVDQAAMTRALQERWIAGAGLDVFTKEPPDPADPLLKLDNVVLCPHALAWTEELARDNGIEACDNILAMARGEVPPGAVNRAVLDRPEFQLKLNRYRSWS